MQILYSDKYLAVVIKPIAVLSQDSETDKCMPALIRQALECEYVGTVHRLDKNVGGIMVYSLLPSITGKLSQIISDKSITEKKYLAVLSKPPAENEGELTDMLYHDLKTNKTFVVKKRRNGVKEARLKYKILQKNEEKCLASVTLMTGRTHQIRVQFASRGCPLIGDARYGGGKGDPALYSHSLSFTHPITNEHLNFSSIPTDSHFSDFDLKDINIGGK